MSEVEMVAKTIRLPVYLVDQLMQRALVGRRSFTKQVEFILENAMDGSVKADLEMLASMGAKSVMSGS